jgi:hypothetical protein
MSFLVSYLKDGYVVPILATAAAGGVALYYFSKKPPQLPADAIIDAIHCVHGFIKRGFHFIEVISNYEKSG